MIEAMLGPTMNYSVAYWKNAKTLEEAQENKLNLIARKLNLSPGMKVLDLGCGWGVLAKYLATHFEVSVVGCTLGQEGAKYARSRCEGLPVEIIIKDYRDLGFYQEFDRIVGNEILEHVGIKNYREFFGLAKQYLKDDGLILVGVGGLDSSLHFRVDELTDKYIFPNVMNPCISDITKASEELLVMEDWHNFGFDYYTTQMAWLENFKKTWPSLSSTDPKYDAEFYRIYEFHMNYGAAAFRARRVQCWQIVFSKKGYPKGYQSER